jgi:hypothetical protein
LINLSGRYNAVKQAIESGEMLQLYMTVTPTVGNKLYITNDDIYDNQFKIDKYVQSGSSLEIGTCAAAELTCELNNSDGKFNGVRFEGAEIMVEVYLPSITESATGEPVKYKLGYFTVDEKPRMLETISIAALDRMVQFDRPVASDVEFGAVTFQSLVSTCCEKCSVPFDAENFNTVYPLGDRKATVRPDDENLTYRNIIQYIAELGLCCAYIGTDGKLKFGFYKDTNVSGQIFILDPNNMFSHTMDDEEEKGIDSVTIIKDEQSLSSGIAESQKISSVNYSLSFELKDVPLGETSFNQDTLKTLYEKKILRLKGIADQVIYIPYSAQTFSYFFLEPLDSISLCDGISEKTYDTLITHITFNLNQNMLVEAKGESDTKKGYATLNPLTAEEQNILRKIRESVSKVAQSVTGRELKLIEFNKTLNSAGALYHNIVAGEDNAPYDVYSDSSVLSNSTKFMITNSAGVGWSNSPWVEPGDEDPEVFCEYYISFDGSAVLSDLDAYKIKANLIQAGSIVSNNGSTYFNLDDNVLVISSYKKGSTVSSGAYEIEMQSGQIDFKGATSDGSLGRTAKMRTGYTKNGDNYTGKHFAIGYISNTSGDGADGANSLKFGAFDSKTDKFSTILQLNASDNAIFSADIDGKVNVLNKLGHFESNTEHNANAEYVGVNEFSIGLKHCSASKNGSDYAWRQHYFGSYIDSSYRHWTGWQAYNSSGNFMHSLTSMQADYASDTVVMRFAASSSTAYIGAGSNAVYFQKEYGAFNKDRAMLSLYCDDVYLSNGTASGTSVKERLTDLYANKVGISVTGTGQVDSETHYATLLRHNNNLAELYSVTGKTKINNATHSEQLNGLKYISTYGSGGTFFLKFRGYGADYGVSGVQINGEIGCSTAHNFGFYISEDHNIYANIYAANINSGSSQEYKENISLATVNALDLVENSKIYSFNYKSGDNELTTDSVDEITLTESTGANNAEEPKTYGFIIERETPEEVISDDGKAVNLYAMASINWKATQELLKRLNTLEEKITASEVTE